MKNLTQLPWSGKGSKAKNDNTLGHAHAFPLILTLLFTFGVGQMWAGQYNLYWQGKVYFRVPDNWDVSAYDHIQVGCARTTNTNTETYQCFFGEMTNISHTHLYYNSISADHSSWNQNEYIFFTANSNNYGNGSFNVNTSHYYTTPLDYGPNNSSNYYLFNPETENNGPAVAGSWNSKRDNLFKLINTIAVKVKKAGSDSYVTPSSAAEMPATSISVTAYYLNGENSSTSNTVSLSGTTYSNSFYGCPGGEITLSQTPKSGYQFDGYYVSSSSISSPYYPTSGSAITIEARYTEIASTVTLTASPSDKGTFTIGGAAATSTTAGVTTTKAVTAVPISGYHFVSWSITGGAHISSTTTNPTTVTGDGTGDAATLTATFEADAVNSLTVSAGTHVTTVTGSTSPVTLGNKYAINATAFETGWQFLNWTATPAANGTFDNASSASTNVTVKNGSVVVTANAQEIMRTITISGGTVYGGVATSTTAGVATTAKVTANAPAEGKKFTGWSLGAGVSLKGGYALTDQTIEIYSTANATVTATYADRAGVKIYFAKPPVWDASTLYAYAWQNDGSEKNATYPGVVLSTTEVINCVTYYTYQYYTEGDGISGAATGNSAWNRIIFGCNDDTKKTGDLTISNGHYYYWNSTTTGAASAVSDVWYIKGTMNAWGTSDPIVHDCANHKGTASINLTEGTTYEFKVYDVINAKMWSNSTACGGGNKITETMPSAVTLYNNDDNVMKITANVTGSYAFEVSNTNTTSPKIKVTFPTKYTVTYSVSPSGAANAITTSPSVTSGGYVAAGTSVTFTHAAAKTGYSWYRWEDGSGSVLGTGSTYTTTINANTTVVAKYTENTYNVTATASAGGSATPTSAISMGQITGGDITATPNTGYNFTDWTITSGTGYFGASGTSTTSTTANTKFRPTADATVKATFAPKTTTITLNNQDATTPGTTEVTATYDAAMPAITLPEKTGYTFGGYFGAPGGGDPKYYNADGSSAQNWNNVDATYTLYAKWTANGYTVTIDVDEENKGTITGATPSQSVTYGAALTTIPNLPTAAAGYGLDGYYTDQNGAGTKVINGDGTWIASVDGYTDAETKWIHADNVTLYAYYKQAEITELTLVETIVGTAGTDSITVTPVIAPLPAGTTIVCWEVQYSNGTALPSQPAGRLVSGNTYRFKAPTASATYRIQATLRSGADCGGGSVLSTRAATFQVAGEHVVTILYQDGDGRTLAASTEIEARPLEWTTLGDITPPAITGYTFVRWDAGDGVSIKNGEDDPVTTTTTSSIQIKATYDGTLKAVYNKKKMIFFNNTLGWSDVYVYFYNTDKYWSGEYGSGAQQNQAFDGDSKPYWEEEHGHMTQIEGTNVWYFDYTETGYPTRANVVFTEADQHGNQWFYKTKAVRSGGHTSSLPMFVPINEKSVTKNETDYYNHGYWMNYPENTGYTLKIYNQKATAGAVELRSVPFAYSADLIMPLEVKVDLEAGRTYGFKIYRADGTTYGNTGTMTANTPNLKMTSDAASNCGLTTTAAGDYTFNLYYSDYNEDGDYQYRVDVTYPVAANDYRIVYSDLAAWSGAMHTAAWIHPSRVITKNSGSEAKQDTVSFFWAYGSSPALKYQTCTEVGTGSATWSAGTAISVSSFSSVLTETGVYNFIFEQPAGGASISLVKVEPYNGKYYIRTDCAGATKWANYRTMDHEMTYSDYAETNSGFSHYFAHWVTSGTNVKFTIANDYSPCVSDTLTADYGTVVANINAGGDLMSGNANIRFMWNQVTNKLSRAYIAGSGNIADRFLVLEGDAKMYDENGNALTGEHQDHNQHGTKLGTDNQVIMHDKENFVYERTIQVNTKARARLSAAYNGKTQYFIGSSGDFADGTTVELLGGEPSATKYTMRIVYDFKTNRLVTAYMPSNAAITEPLAINADIMLVRENQNAGQQLTFESEGSLSEVKTVYGVMRFNRWTLNNKSTAAGHAPVGDPKSTYERSLYWISFPFDVNLSDVFGFGTYGTHWIIEYYDGDERATEGYWADSEGFWKYVTNRNGYKLEAGKGYILALDLDLMRDNNDSFWANNIEQVELFFPSAKAVGNIKETDTEIVIPAHECTIAARPGMSDDRRKKDSHWNIIGVPSYANYGSELKDGNNATITWNDNPATKDMPFLYEWNMVDNTYSVQSGTTYPFKSMHAYMVQYNGKLKWSLASATPVSPVIARQTDTPKDVEFRIELQAGEKVADQTFVKMSTDEQISTAFDFNYDLSKQMNSGKANIYTMVEGYIQTAGNCLPMSEQTTVVPVGVKIAADGDYTFAIPDGTAGIGVTLIDTETGIRTNLSALTYTIALTAGTYDNRFVIEFSPIRNVPTEQPDVRSQKSEVSKVLIDGLLYIVRDNKMYDARGAMIMEK